MSRVVTSRKQRMPPASPLEIMMREYLRALAVQNYSEYTISNREFHLVSFIQWCQERGVADPVEVTRHPRTLSALSVPLSEEERRADELPFAALAPGSPADVVRWMTRRNHLLHNPASELELPRLGQPLPRNILSAREVEQILQLCNIDDTIGLRDRAVMEVLYSTGMRRGEVVALKLYDLSFDRGVLLVRQGKGKKDRYVPIGERAIAWLEKYIREARPQLAAEPDDMTVFLTAQGEPFSRDHMTSNVKARIDAAKLGKTGACISSGTRWPR